MDYLVAWARIFGEFALHVVAIRMTFYRNSIKVPDAARLNQELHEEDGFLPENSSIDERAKAMETLRIVIKSFSALTAINAAKKAGGGGGAE